MSSCKGRFKPSKLTCSLDSPADWADDVVDEAPAPTPQPRSYNRASVKDRRASFGRQNAVVVETADMESLIVKGWMLPSVMVRGCSNMAVKLLTVTLGVVSELNSFEGSDQLKLANRANRWNTFVICRQLLWITQASEGYTILTKLLTDAADQAGPIILVFQV